MHLSTELNRKILKLAPRFEIRNVAPHSFETLKSHGSLVVWPGASDSTIYGDPKVNWAFRAWHDSLHLKLDAPFTLEGETRVALEQSRLVGSDSMGAVIMAEVVGQARYFATHGRFPHDQVEFIVNYLKGII